uniref:ankyrin repeat domain-containing protein 6 isoform X2 n=1 Tax=Doryrhamphus excisus TaxID=161450 RepID=UPI0025AE7CFA|nr:ankyrin repeat domain-containing protein 6 isoform X2 [Doryrhamphus excisus]
MDQRVPIPHPPLHQAAAMGNNAAIAALIGGGCALDLQNRDGNTALHEASWHGFFQCVQLLVKAGADVNIRNKAGHTALHLASQNAHAHTARLLLRGGARPDIANNVGDTCLHVAARYNNATLVKILLGSLRSADQRNQKGDTALHVAAALNHKKTVRLLLESGSAGNITNNEGKTALDKARDNNHKHVTRLLARDPQVHWYLRGRTIRKIKLLTAKHGTTPLTGKKGSSSLVGETSSSDASMGQMQNHVTPAAVIRPKKGEEQAFHVRKTLWTNYRKPYKHGIIPQTPSRGCRCRALIDKLEEQLKATQEEMSLQTLRMQEINNVLCRMDLRNKQQILPHKMHLASVKEAAPRDELRRRVAQNQVQNHGYKLLRSPRAESDTELESTPLLSVVSAHSSTSLATYVNILPSKATRSLTAVKQDEYFEMKVNRPPGDYENIFWLPGHHDLGFPTGSDGPCCQSPGVQDIRQSDRAQIQADCTRTLEFIIQPPLELESTFTQERDTLHAVEVTQRFFETVSVQLERWYERKVLEVEEQTELRLQQDIQELLHHIGTLEEELRRMKIDEKAEKT